VDKQQYDELAVSLALVLDRENYLKEKLQQVAGDILEEQTRLRKMRQALIGSSTADGLLQTLGPVLHAETGDKAFAGGVLTIVNGSEVVYDETAVIAMLAKQNRLSYFKLKRREVEAMLRVEMKYEDVPAHLVTGPKIQGIDSVNIGKGFTVPLDVQFDVVAIEAQIERAQAEHKAMEQTEAASHSDELLESLNNQTDSEWLLDLLKRGAGEDSPEYGEARKLFFARHAQKDATAADEEDSAL